MDKNFLHPPIIYRFTSTLTEMEKSSGNEKSVQLHKPRESEDQRSPQATVKLKGNLIISVAHFHTLDSFPQRHLYL